MATEPQITYVLVMLKRLGFNTTFVIAEHKRFGATVTEPPITVRTWLASMNRRECSELIKRLKRHVDPWE